MYWFVGLRRIFARPLQNDLLPAGMFFLELGDIVSSAMNDDPWTPSVNEHWETRRRRRRRRKRTAVLIVVMLADLFATPLLGLGLLVWFIAIHGRKISSRFDQKVIDQ